MQDPWVQPLCVLPGAEAQAQRGPWAPHLPHLPHRRLSPGRLSWERCVVGTPHSGYPSLPAMVIPDGRRTQGLAGWVWRVWGTSECPIPPEMLVILRGGGLLCAQVPPSGSQSILLATMWVMGREVGTGTEGTAVAQSQRPQPCCLPTPTVSQRCLFFPAHTLCHGASSFPSYSEGF